MAQEISQNGIAYLESREGVVLKAYRDAKGVWTIGAGLTAASGVVSPKAGMVISQTVARDLLLKALRRNYEPRVAKVFGRCVQNVFDGATSFDYNTGAIDSASWVKAFLAGDFARARANLGLWVKSGGKVLPGLQRRRAEEADIVIDNRWPSDLHIAIEPQKPTVAFAGLVISLTAEEIANIAAGLRDLGYDAGEIAGKVKLQAVTRFQADHGLTVDGLIGKATLSTLQRELDARSTVKKGGGVAAGGTAVAIGNETVVPPAGHVPGSELVGDPLVTWGAVVVGVIGVVWLAYLAWHYRDIIAARVQPLSPRLADWLRSL